MTKTSNYWDKRAIKRLSEAEKTSEVYIERIKKIYEQAYKNIDGEIARVYKNYSNETGLNTQKLKELLTRSETKKTWEQMKRQGLDKYIKNNYKSRISRLEQIQAQIYAKAKQIYPKEELEQTMCYKGVINNSYYKAVYDTQIGTSYDFGFNKIDNNMYQTLLNEKWSGKNYSQRIWGNTDILADNLSQVVGGALLSGQSIEKTSKQIRDRFDVSKHYAERLIRTETNHFNNEADAMAYEEMGIDKYVFVATLDGRTSLICQSMDNKVFDYKDREVGVNFPPLHPNCRSKTRGYLGEELEKTLKRRARNPITGKTELIDNVSYKDWLKQHSVVDTKTSNSDENITYKKLNEKEINELGKSSDICYNKLTKNEKDAMYEYAMGGYQDVNDYLNGKYEGFDGINDMINDIDNSMSKYTLEDNVVSYRGTNAKYYENYDIGNTIKTNMYFSTSLNENIANTFMEDSDNPLMLEIRIPKGTKSIYIGDNTHYEFEAELLLARNLNYKIIDKVENKLILEVVK